MVAANEEAIDLSKLTLDELCGSLEAHKKRMGRLCTQSFEQAFQSKVKITDNKNSKNEQENKASSSSKQRNQTGEGRGKKKFRGQGIGKRSFSSQRNSSANSDSQCIICKKIHKNRSLSCYFYNIE